MIGALRSGRLGVQLTLPAQLEVVADGEHEVQLAGGDEPVMWWLLFFPSLPFVVAGPSELAVFRDGADAYARRMFDDMFRELHPEGDAQPRTADASWSPLVDVERLTIRGAPAMRTVHRMVYEPGKEIIMGHVLLPLARGLFEARVVCGVTQTGYRESTVVLMHGGSRLLTQATYDALEHDATFPQHPLSVVRRALASFVNDAVVTVGAPAATTATPQDARVPLREGRASIAAPPLFTLIEAQSVRWTFARVAFCGTDGVEHLIVERVEQRAPPAARLVEEAARRARAFHEDAQVQDIHIAAHQGPQVDAMTTALVTVTGQGFRLPRRSVMLWFIVDDELWHASITGADVVPADGHARLVIDAVRSWRREGDGF